MMSIKLFAESAIELEISSIARITLNRPHVANAASERMWTGLIEACAFVSNSRDIRALIISGAGSNFCAGADISEFPRIYASTESAGSYNRLYQKAEAALRDIPQPVIAELRGACVGGGLGLALSADLRFADDTVKMGVTASKLGVAYPPEDCARVIEKIGLAHAKDLFFSSRMIEGAEALSWGLLDRLIPEQQLSAAVHSYAGLLAEQSASSIGAIKAIVNALNAPDPALCDELRPLYSDLFAGDDFIEGRSAFLEKREPRFL